MLLKTHILDSFFFCNRLNESVSSRQLWLLATAKLKIRQRLRLYLGHVLLMLIVSTLH